MALVISESDYNYVLSALGYPLIDPTEISLPYDETTVKEYCILPSLHEYFRWFPIESKQSISIGGGAVGTVDYPDEKTFTVVHSAFTGINDTTDLTQSFSINPFVTARTFRSTGNDTLWGRYDYGMDTIRQSLKISEDSQISANRVFRFNPDDNARVADYYCSVEGTIDITWAKWSDNFNDIPWDKKREVLELCKAEFLLWVGNLLGQISTDVPTELDSDAMITRGEDMKDKVLNKWKNYTKPVFLR